MRSGWYSITVNDWSVAISIWSIVHSEWSINNSIELDITCPIRALVFDAEEEEEENKQQQKQRKIQKERISKWEGEGEL